MIRIQIFLALMIFVALTVEASIAKDSVVIEEKITLQSKTGEVFGTLTTPEKFDKIPVALIIAGSGPTDRDGNGPLLKNNSLKLLAFELSKNGIAVLRYDKRGIGESHAAMKSETDLRFEDYVNDAKEWIQLLKQDNRFSQVTVIGHSEGSLIGMLTAKDADKFISIAGAGQSADKILKEQLGSQSKEVRDLTFPIIDSLKNGRTIDNVTPFLYSLFRPSVQPYLISWFKYDPENEITKISIPTLILQGTNDIQVSVEDAKRLSDANPKAELVIIKNMNHILKIIEGDRQANLATYGNVDLPIASELARSISTFILKN